MHSAKQTITWGKESDLSISEESKTFWIIFKSSELVSLLTVNRPTKYLDICFTGESKLTFKETIEEPGFHVAVYLGVGLRFNTTEAQAPRVYK